jgi:hypothetical protein
MKSKLARQAPEIFGAKRGEKIIRAAIYGNG